MVKGKKRNFILVITLKNCNECIKASQRQLHYQESNKNFLLLRHTVEQKKN